MLNENTSDRYVLKIYNTELVHFSMKKEVLRDLLQKSSGSMIMYQSCFLLIWN